MKWFSSPLSPHLRRRIVSSSKYCLERLEGWGRRECLYHPLHVAAVFLQKAPLFPKSRESICETWSWLALLWRCCGPNLQDNLGFVACAGPWANGTAWHESLTKLWRSMTFLRAFISTSEAILPLPDSPRCCWHHSMAPLSSVLTFTHSF